MLIALGAHGTTATLMTLALIATATANSGPLLGVACRRAGASARCCSIFNWLITALSFPIIGLAVLYFPHRAEILDRHKWIVPAVIAASLPMFVIGVGHGGVPARLGRDAAGAVVGRDARLDVRRGVRAALAVNVLIVVEGIARYRVNLDADERRRIQIVVFTGVPAVFAYALKTGIPLVLGLLGIRSNCRG